jgi:hypothetical protein
MAILVRQPGGPGIALSRVFLHPRLAAGWPAVQKTGRLTVVGQPGGNSVIKAAEWLADTWAER